MPTLRRFSSHIAAQDAALALRAAGIVATVVSDTDPLTYASFSAGFGPFAVVIDGVEGLEAARKVLDELDANPISADPAWEDSVAEPDLSRLDPALDIPCPHCAYNLRGLLRAGSNEVECPECGGRVDLIKALLQRHGPEALEGCYPEPVDLTPDEVVESAPLVCPGCRYPLRGLPPAGRCPECGSPYSKRDMLRG